ncbi:MAG TPA: helix-turn-helix transcriptional regulator [Methylocella sp.]|nr:helix-turn-helix transcriptional regulator [Methylocella sp.]
MSDDRDFIALIDFIYAAVLDGNLWPTVLGKLAHATSTMQAIIATMDQRTNSFASISRRAYPDLEASYWNYWAFHNPLWTNTMSFPAGKVYSLDALMPRQEFIRTPVFNEWWKPADYSLGMLGVNVYAEERVSSLICVINAPGHDVLTNEQTRIFAAAVRHVARAIRIHRRLRTLDYMNGSTPERFEGWHRGAILADAAGNALYINAAARALLDAENGLVLKDGCLATTDGRDTLQRLIASCAPMIGPLRGPLGGEFQIPRGPQRAPLQATVTPFRTKELLPEVPWLGLRAPVAMITIIDPETVRQRLVRDLHERFGLTAAEAGLAAEIVKGDGREAAARRRGISVATARSQLSSIFEKTGTHRQAELVHLLLELANTAN